MEPMAVNDQPVIRLDGVTKEYVKYEDTPTLLGHALRWNRTKRSTLVAISDLNLEVARGETVGVIGRNGSGKSTMLRMVAGVTAPTSGRTEINGRVAPLISVGVGFHPELTGRENVYVNGTILGLSRDQIDDRFDEIVGFAEIAPFIDTPVKFYSSGMFVRLGFSVAVAAQPDVLIIDEVLAVGDIAFQGKCFDRMEEMRQGGATVLVVSHNLNAIIRLCERTLVLDRGMTRFVGDTHDAVELYHRILAEDGPTDAGEGSAGGPSLAARLLGPDRRPVAKVEAGGELTVRVSVSGPPPSNNAHLGVHVNSATGVMVYSETVPFAPLAGPADSPAVLDIRFRTQMPSGSYKVKAVLVWGGEPHERAVSPVIDFYVDGRPMVHGLADFEAVFEVPAEIVSPPGPGSEDEAAVADATPDHRHDLGDVDQEHPRQRSQPAPQTGGAGLDQHPVTDPGQHGYQAEPPQR
jgi:ABC-2 type transport system ATP-binding protein